MSRRSALVAVFVAMSALTEPAGALVLTAIVLAPFAAAHLARAFTDARNGTADA